MIIYNKNYPGWRDVGLFQQSGEYWTSQSGIITQYTGRHF